MIIGVLGTIGSGKDTVGKYLISEYNYKKDSFAASLKDSCASVFNWPRHLLEGDTDESRLFRETVDIWWSNNLNIDNFTPRYALQHIGTDIFRKYFNNDIWFLSLKNRLETSNENIVITDVRFPNEIEFLKSQKAILIEVQRKKPDWYNVALKANKGCSESLKEMKTTYSYVHVSEYSWIGMQDYLVVSNTSTIDFLYQEVEEIILSLND